jgi:cytochrome b
VRDAAPSVRQASLRNLVFEAAQVSDRTVPVRVWDAPTRLFHWAIVILLGLSWLTESRGWMELHFLSGYGVIALLLFRVAWGFAGSETSRFAHFLRSPVAVLRHLAHLPRREPDTEIGHNAAGGWMVLVMLAVLAVQAATGLCANDDGDTEGPLFRYVGKERSDWLSHIHAVNFRLIQIVVALHIVAVLVYLGLKRHDLVRPMITGRKYLPAMLPPPALVSPVRAAILFAAAAGIVWLFVASL